MMESLGQSADAKEIAVMVKEFDTDGNGVIDCMYSPHVVCVLTIGRWGICKDNARPDK